MEDLFYNMPTRRKAFKNLGDEYQRVVDVVSRYAIHNHSVSFSCRKQNAPTPDVQTSVVGGDATARDAVRQVYGAAVARELLDVEHVANGGSAIKFKVRGLLSNANYSSKRFTMLLFINSRWLTID